MMKRIDWSLLFYLVFPIGAVSIVTWKWATFLIIAGLTPFLAILIGAIIGISAVAAMTAASGNDMTDLIVSSVIVVGLTFFFLPVLENAQQKAEKSRIRKQLKRKQNAVRTPLSKIQNFTVNRTRKP